MWLFIYILKWLSLPITIFPILYNFFQTYFCSRKYVYKLIDPGINIRFEKYFKYLKWVCFFKKESIKTHNTNNILKTPALYILNPTTFSVLQHTLHTLDKYSIKTQSTLAISDDQINKKLSIMLDLIDVLFYKKSDVDNLIKQSKNNISQNQSLIICPKDKEEYLFLLNLAYKNTLPIIPVSTTNSKIIKKHSNQLLINFASTIRPHKYLNLSKEQLYKQLINIFDSTKKENISKIKKIYKKSCDAHQEIIKETKSKITKCFK